MADVFSQEKRSHVMSCIRSGGNKETELRLIKIFKAASIKGWRRKQPLLGKPDFVFRKERVVVFVDGCFWHACPRCYHRPGSNQTYWDAKALRNQTRDRVVSNALRKMGWRVLRIWDHELAEKNRKRLLSRIRRALLLKIQFPKGRGRT